MIDVKTKKDNTFILGFKKTWRIPGVHPWRQDSSLHGHVAKSGHGLPGSSPAVTDNFYWCAHMQLPKLFKFVG